MTVITISRELGSGGSDISKQVARILGYQFVDKNLVEAVLQQYGMVEFDKLYKTTPGFWTRYDRMNLEIVSMLNKTLLALAQRGKMVILGRGGFAILKGYADVLNVYIRAPFEQRVQRVMEMEKIGSWQDAEAYVRKNDEIRTGFIRMYYDTEWDKASAFNLVIDTGHVQPVMAVDWIVEAARAIELKPILGGPYTREIVVDNILSFTIDTVFEEAERQKVLEFG
jgi:cytidylate kinase